MTYQWNGRFVSDSTGTCFGFPMVKGKITTILPTVIGDTNNSSVTLEYDGFYRMGQKTNMIISYSTIIDNSTIGGQGKQIGVSSGFKGNSMLTQQTIDFVINYATDTMIDGTYYSQSPRDHGTFQISRQLQIR